MRKLMFPLLCGIIFILGSCSDKSKFIKDAIDQEADYYTEFYNLASKGDCAGAILVADKIAALDAEMEKTVSGDEAMNQEYEKLRGYIDDKMSVKSVSMGYKMYRLYRHMLDTQSGVKEFSFRDDGKEIEWKSAHGAPLSIRIE